ncbi:MAG: sugar ABC transporter permease [Spirochaetaceae bacterium]|jgi:multiple sugar transport system permease protein|nr:sugar ABC transporter permease [Spirochaetaceae bacterium]
MQKLQDMEKQKRLLIVVFLTVPLAMLFIFSYIPIIFNVFLGFTDWDGVTKIKMTGLRNYQRIFSDPQYLLLFRNCLWYLLVAIPQLLLSFVLAILVNGKFRGLSIFKSILIFPYMLNGIIVAAIFITFFNSSGTLNTLLRSLGLDSLSRNWLQDLKIVNPAIASISIWRYYGMAFIMFFGSLQAIPSELYESAAIDGCNKWQEIRHISVPFIKKVLFINVLLSISGSIQVFEIPYIMLGGSNGTAVPVIQIQQSMGDGRIGFAAAMSIVVFFVVVISVGLQRIFVKEED